MIVGVRVGMGFVLLRVSNFALGLWCSAVVVRLGLGVGWSPQVCVDVGWSLLSRAVGGVHVMWRFVLGVWGVV